MKPLDSYHEMYVIGSVISIVLVSPQLQLTELIKQIKEAINTVASTVCRLLAHFGLTRKKVQRVALQQSIHILASFVANTCIFSREMFVWVDETKCNYKDMLRRYGYPLQSERDLN